MALFHFQTDLGYGPKERNMFVLICSSLLSIATGFAIRHFVWSKFLPLSADAKELRDSVVAHLDSMANKSEIMIRHDAVVFRNTIAGR
jgi:hypothetical protein